MVVGSPFIVASNSLMSIRILYLPSNTRNGLSISVVVISAGKIALDLDVPVERPRRRGSAELARLEGTILDRLFG